METAVVDLDRLYFAGREHSEEYDEFIFNQWLPITPYWQLNTFFDILNDMHVNFRESETLKRGGSCRLSISFQIFKHFPQPLLLP